MRNKSDRRFHLAIAVIAMIVTAVSVASIVYQVVPVQGWSTWRTQVNANTPVASSVNGSAETLTSSQTFDKTTNTVQGRVPSTYQASAASLSMVHVTGYGKGVTAANLNRVKNMLVRVNSLGLINQTLHLNLKKPMTIFVVNQTSSYDAALKYLGVQASVAANLAQTTGGFAANSDIIIPLNENTADTQLANTLTHEMTHVFLNQDIGPMPSWTNEGIAVFMGMRGQKAIETATGFEGDERQLAEDILDVAQSGQLVSLTGNENAILSGQESYDYELQDWLAMSDLVSQHGIASVQRYLQLMGENAGEKQSFIVAFGEREDIFNNQCTKLLQAAAQARNVGATMTFSIAPTYRGDIEFLGAGRTVWHGIVAQPGNYQIKVDAGGTVSSTLPTVAPRKDKNPPDGNTVYISLLPSSTVMWNGKKVQDCGFALDLHNGLYAFEDGWVHLADGRTQYNAMPTLFGVSVSSVQELNEQNPLLPVLNAV